MSLTSTAIGQLEKCLPKVLDARAHGMIDYSHAAFSEHGADLAKEEPAVALLTGSFVLTQSLLTDYPLGASPVIPFEAHGKMDAAFAGLSFVMPNLLGFEGTAAATVFKGNAFAEATVVGLTNLNNGDARHEKTSA